MDLKRINEMVAAVCSSRTVTELTVRQGAGRLTVKRALAEVGTEQPVAVPQAVLAAPEPAHEAESCVVRSHLVGIFHQRASERQAPVPVGAAIKEGQVIGAIESMGMLYNVTAAVSGAVVEVLVDDEQPVEYGQELFRVQPA